MECLEIWEVQGIWVHLEELETWDLAAQEIWGPGIWDRPVDLEIRDRPVARELWALADLEIWDRLVVLEILEGRVEETWEDPVGLETWGDPGTLEDQEIWVQAGQETRELLEVESRSIRGVALRVRVETGVLITTEIVVEMVPSLVLAENQASNLLLLPSIKSR